jgi:chromosome segregation ATPase
LKQLKTKQLDEESLRAYFEAESQSNTKAGLKDKLGKSDVHSKELKQQIQDLQDATYPMKSKIKDLQQFVKSTQNDSIMCELAEKRAKVKQLDSEKAGYFKRIKVQADQLQSIKDELQAAKHISTKYADDLMRREAELGALKQEFSFLTDSYTDVLTKLTENLKALANLKEANRQLEEEKEHLKVRAAIAFHEMTPRVDFSPVLYRKVLDELNLKLHRRVSSEEKMEEMLQSIKLLKGSRPRKAKISLKRSPTTVRR